jgi:hypothetical protein
MEELGYHASIWNGRDTEEGDQAGIGMRGMVTFQVSRDQ